MSAVLGFANAGAGLAPLVLIALLTLLDGDDR